MTFGATKNRAMRIAVIVLLSCRGISLGGPTTGPTTAPFKLIQSKYDRFEGVTNVTLKLRPEISLGFSYAGELPTKTVDAVMIGCAKSPYYGEAIGLIWLADGNRERLGMDPSMHLLSMPIELLERLSDSKKLELAIVYETGRGEITFSDDEILLLKRFFDASPDARSKAEAAKVAAAAAVEAKRVWDQEEAEQREAKKQAAQRAAAEQLTAQRAMAEQLAAKRAAAEKRMRFVRVDGGTKKVLYLCQASGSMLSVFSKLKTELYNSIEQLKPDQSFDVVFFRDDKVFTLGTAGNHQAVPETRPAELIPATPENKRKAYDFIGSQVSSGSTQPIPAIELAFGERPEVIFLFTNGFTQAANLSDVTDAFAKGNANNKFKIKCVFFKAEDIPEFGDALQKIVHDNGGSLETMLPTDD